MNRSMFVAARAVKNMSSVQRTFNMCTVASKTIQLTFVDVDGNRATVPARIGQTLMEAALQHKIDIEGPCGGGGAPTQSRRTESWVETTWGEGPSCFFCHVQIASKYNSVLPEIFEHERKGIADIWDDEYTRNSRLACKIRLDARHDGMVVYVPDSPVADCI